MPTGKLITTTIFILLLTSCLSAPTQAPLPTEIPAQIVEVTYTPPPTPTETLTPTPDISTMTVQEIVGLYISGKIIYPSEWTDDKKAEFSIALAERVNKNAHDTVRITTTLRGEKNYTLYWDTASNEWHSDHNVPLYL